MLQSFGWSLKIMQQKLKAELECKTGSNFFSFNITLSQKTFSTGLAKTLQDLIKIYNICSITKYFVDTLFLIIQCLSCSRCNT